MKIKELFEQKKTVISLEVFPPKTQASIDTVYQTLEELRDVKPDFISVTYGAGGTSKGRTVEIASKIKNKYGIEALAHLTCIASTREEIGSILNELKENNIENILAMRGDLPEDPDFEFPNPLQYEHAKDLIGQIKQDKNEFCIGAACYPEVHPDCKSKVLDIKYLKEKVEQGADFLISQLFFDNEKFYSFLEDMDMAGLDIPVCAGIMPVLNTKQITRMTALSGCSMPPKFIRILEKYEHNPEALKEAGEAYAIEQIIDLMAYGVRGIHLYTMNKSQTTKRIMANIENIRRFT